MILNVIPAHEYTKNGIYLNQLKIASKPLTNEGLRLIAKNNSESKKLLEQFNEGLKALKKNGTYNQLLLKWGLFDPEKNEKSFDKSLSKIRGTIVKNL